jgi:transcriptional regulator
MYDRDMSGDDINARDLQRGSAEMLVLALLEERQRHGYEIAQLIDQRSGGEIRFQVPSLYPLLYRLERRGLVEGRWVEKAGERRRRFYRLTAAGRSALGAQRRGWKSLFEALDRVARFRQA